MTSLTGKDIPFLPQGSISSEILEELNDSSANQYEDSINDDLMPKNYPHDLLTKQTSMFTSSSGKRSDTLSLGHTSMSSGSNYRRG